MRGEDERTRISVSKSLACITISDGDEQVFYPRWDPVCRIVDRKRDTPGCVVDAGVFGYDGRHRNVVGVCNFKGGHARPHKIPNNCNDSGDQYSNGKYGMSPPPTGFPFSLNREWQFWWRLLQCMDGPAFIRRCQDISVLGLQGNGAILVGQDRRRSLFDVDGCHRGKGITLMVRIWQIRICPLQMLLLLVVIASARSLGVWVLESVGRRQFPRAAVRSRPGMSNVWIEITAILSSLYQRRMVFGFNWPRFYLDLS